MSLNKFMGDNLIVIREEIIRNIPTNKFDSHEFIRNFAKRFEIEYVKYLSSHKQEPFRNVHAQIGKFLSENQNLLRIKDDGVTQSENIFGNVTQNESWVKTL